MRRRALLLGIPVALTACGAPLLELMSANPRAVSTLHVAGSTLRVEVVTRATVLPFAAYETWVLRAAMMVVAYYGRFPVEHLRVRVLTGTFGGVVFGQHHRGERVSVLVGGSIDEGTLERDWVMVHEMLHAAFPRMGQSHRWMQEGLSTYLETVVRRRAGVITEEEAWRTLATSLPIGLPEAGDRGLDRTATWARTYWGGALFWFVVDVDIRRTTAGRFSLDDAVRTVLEAGGDARNLWSPSEVIAIADAATGTTVLGDRYRELARRPGTVDLDDLFERLGVLREGDAVRVVDGRELSWLREAVGAPSALPLPPIPRSSIG